MKTTKEILDTSNPIAQAVLPLKSAAVERAAQVAQKRIDEVMAELAAANWDAKVCAPYPSAMQSRAGYAQGMAKYQLFRSLTKSTATGSRSPRDPEPVAKWDEGCTRFIEAMKAAAASNYDAFVIKLYGKIGEVKTATLSGNHVWAHSDLKVVTAAGVGETWRTQMIMNVSVLGKLFNQWPTRKIKRPARED